MVEEKIMGHPGGEAGADAATLKGAAFGQLTVGGRNGYGVLKGTTVRDGQGFTVAVAIGDIPELKPDRLAALIAAAPELLEAGRALARAVEDVRDDQVSHAMGFGVTAAERQDRRRQLAHFIELNAEQVADALDAMWAAIAKATNTPPVSDGVGHGTTSGSDAGSSVPGGQNPSNKATGHD